jgi:hypothetical protein
MSQLAIIATLRPGAEERARLLLDQGPPFDPVERGFARHTVFLSANEIVFVFEAPEVTWRLDDLVDRQFDVVMQDAFEAWRPVIDGPPRIARVAYDWADESASRSPFSSA